MHIMIMPDAILMSISSCLDKATSTSRYGQKRNYVAMSMSGRPISCQYKAACHQDEARFPFERGPCHISMTPDT